MQSVERCAAETTWPKPTKQDQGGGMRMREKEHTVGDCWSHITVRPGPLADFINPTHQVPAGTQTKTNEQVGNTQSRPYRAVIMCCMSCIEWQKLNARSKVFLQWLDLLKCSGPQSVQTYL